MSGVQPAPLRYQVEAPDIEEGRNLPARQTLILHPAQDLELEVEIVDDAPFRHQTSFPIGLVRGDPRPQRINADVVRAGGGAQAASALPVGRDGSKLLFLCVPGHFDSSNSSRFRGSDHRLLDTIVAA